MHNNKASIVEKFLMYLTLFIIIIYLTYTHLKHFMLPWISESTAYPIF